MSDRIIRVQWRNCDACPGSDAKPYYPDSYAACTWGEPDHRRWKRVDFLKVLPSRGGVFVEIHANRSSLSQLGRAGLSRGQITVELMERVVWDLRALQDLPDDWVDLLAIYFVLGRPRALEGLKHCGRVRRDGGSVVLELPDLLLYSGDTSALQFYEHTNGVSWAWPPSVCAHPRLNEILFSNESCSRSLAFASKMAPPLYVRIRVPFPKTAQQAKKRTRDFVSAFKRLSRNFERQRARCALGNKRANGPIPGQIPGARPYCDRRFQTGKAGLLREAPSSVVRCRQSADCVGHLTLHFSTGSSAPEILQIEPLPNRHFEKAMFSSSIPSVCRIARSSEI